MATFFIKKLKNLFSFFHLKLKKKKFKTFQSQRKSQFNNLNFKFYLEIKLFLLYYYIC